MAKSSCRYNHNTNCDRTELHTWISTLAWQRTLRVKHLQLSMLTQAECHWQQGLAHQNQYRQRHFEENCSVLLPTLVSGSTLLSCNHPDHVSRNKHWNGAPFGFQCCFPFTQSKIVTKNRSISKAKTDNCQLHSSLQSCVVWIALGGPTLRPPNTPFYGHTSSQIFNPVGSLTRQKHWSRLADKFSHWMSNNCNGKSPLLSFSKTKCRAFQTALATASATSSCT